MSVPLKMSAPLKLGRRNLRLTVIWQKTTTLMPEAVRLRRVCLFWELMMLTCPWFILLSYHFQWVNISPQPPPTQTHTQSHKYMNVTPFNFTLAHFVGTFETFNFALAHLQISFCMELFSGSEVDERVMERAGCLNYTHSPWESEKPEVHQRQLYYKLERCIPLYRGEVTSTQQKFRLSVRNRWIIEEVMNLQGVPLGDNFSVGTCSYKYIVLAYLFIHVVLICSFT